MTNRAFDMPDHQGTGVSYVLRDPFPMSWAHTLPPPPTAVHVSEGDAVTEVPVFLAEAGTFRVQGPSGPRMTAAGTGAVDGRGETGPKIVRHDLSVGLPRLSFTYASGSRS